jgi:hypothetical protein
MTTFRHQTAFRHLEAGKKGPTDQGNENAAGLSMPARASATDQVKCKQEDRVRLARLLMSFSLGPLFPRSMPLHVFFPLDPKLLHL